MPRPYCTIVIWRLDRRHKVERYYTIDPNGTVRDLMRHRFIRHNTMLRNVTQAMAAGYRVSYTVCRPDYSVARRADFQRSQEA